MSAATLLAGVPNLISLGRLLLAPVAIAMIVSNAWVEAFLIFVAAGVSDAVDGFLAKRFGLQTELGAYLDPLADKALLITIYVTLAVVGAMPAAIAILVVSRDVLIVGAVIISWLLDRPVKIRPLTISKVNTAMQIILAGAALGAKAFDIPMAIWYVTLLYVVALLTLASTAAYLRQWLRFMEGAPGAGVDR